MANMNFSMITVSIPTVDELLLRPISPQRKQEVLLRLERQARLTELEQTRKHWLENLSKEELIELVNKQWDKLQTLTHDTF